MEAAVTHDVIVVGARVAGAATAMLLARAGLRVLVVDRARFPSDTLSTHQVQVPGITRLHRWGLLDRSPPARRRPCGCGSTRAARFSTAPTRERCTVHVGRSSMRCW
jgi:2-polyprenyl-6-methoxyphenol hydroxylase-like FAD-dependent oxidoreductase